MKVLAKISCITALVALFAAQAHAVLITNEDFTYPDGDLAVQSGGIWAQYSGATPMNVSNGHAIVTDTLAGDDGINFGAGHTNDVLFASFDVTVTSLPRAIASYFALFKDATTFNFGARVFATNDAGSVRFGIDNATTAFTTAMYVGNTVALNSTNKIVIRFDQTGPNMVSTLWLNPSLISDPSVTATDVIAAVYNIQGFGLRQASTSTGAGTENVDNLLIGTTFGDVVAVPEPSTILLVGAGLAGMIAIRRRRS